MIIAAALGLGLFTSNSGRYKTLSRQRSKVLWPLQMYNNTIFKLIFPLLTSLDLNTVTQFVTQYGHLLGPYSIDRKF